MEGQKRDAIGVLATTAIMVWMAALTVMVAGCATLTGGSLSAEEEAAYEVALERRVQGYVYDMSCQALLPMAEQLLWDEGFRELEYEQGDMELNTEWKEAADPTPVQYAVYAHEAGGQRCAVQFMRRHKGKEAQRRDIERELELIEYIDEEEAQRIRDRAKQEAQKPQTQEGRSR